MDMTLEWKPINRGVLNKSCATHTSGLSNSCYMHIRPISHMPYAYACAHTHTHIYKYICMYVSGPPNSYDVYQAHQIQ